MERIKGGPIANIDDLLASNIKPRVTEARFQQHVSSVIYIVVAAFLLRLAAVMVLSHTGMWQNAAELTNIARSIALGQGFSSPFGKPTGATAWLAPVYPFLIAIIFKVFGVVSTSAALAAILFQIAVSALTCIPIMRLGQETGNARVGVWAAWSWAVYPYLVLVPVMFIWDTALSAFLLSLLLLITVRLCRRNHVLNWVLFGTVWGVAALTNTSLLAIMPICFGWLYWKSSITPVTKLIPRFAASVLIFLLLIAPWCWRNWNAFKTFFPVRSSFGEALWLGNHPGGRGRLMYGENAFENPHEFERFRKLGEIAYVKSREKAALTYMASCPLQFLRNAMYRTLYWWFGLGERAPIFLFYSALGIVSLVGVIFVLLSRARDWYFVTYSILFFPVTYYLTDVVGRYRHPIEPAMVLVSTSFVEWLVRRKHSLKSTIRA